MIYLFLLLILLFPGISLADIFSKPAGQTQLDGALSKDAHNFYYRNGFDYNAYAAGSEPYELTREVSLGCNRYDFHESLKNLFTRAEFNSIELQELMNTLSTSKFLLWQYSSPTLADLYKHLDTIGHLRLAIRYRQCQDLEDTVNDPTVKLRKQAIMDCIRHQKGINDQNDIDLAFKSCFDSLSANGNTALPYSTLEDPGDGRTFISKSVNVTDVTLDRINKNDEDLSVIKDIIPKVIVSGSSVTIRGPIQASRELMSSYRNDFISRLTGILSEYKRSKSINLQDLSSLSVFGVPLTAGQVRNLAMLDDAESYLAVHKIASELAYLKTVDQYLQAVKMLERVMNHPAIEPGYKTLLKSSLDFVQKEMSVLKEEKERLKNYAETMHAILDESDRKRLKALAWASQEAVSEQEKGFLKLNP